MKKQTKIVSKSVYWFPRILSLVFVLFLMLFSLDVFEEGLSFWQTILALVIHNIPAFILLILIIIAWKHEIVGAITFVIAGIAYSIVSLVMNKFEWYLLSWSLIIAGPAFLIAILYFIGWKRKN